MEELISMVLTYGLDKVPVNQSLIISAQRYAALVEELGSKASFVLYEKALPGGRIVGKHGLRIVTGPESYLDLFIYMPEYDDATSR